MTIQTHQALLEKISSLPAEGIAEVEDFVDFIRARVLHQSSVSRASPPIEQPMPVRLVTAGAGGLQAGVDLDNNRALLDLMDGV